MPGKEEEGVERQAGGADGKLPQVHKLAKSQPWIPAVPVRLTSEATSCPLLTPWSLCRNQVYHVVANLWPLLADTGPLENGRERDQPPAAIPIYIYMER